MRAYDSHWSAMAGYRVGEALSAAARGLMRIEPPKAADTPRRRQLFQCDEASLRFVLLTKAGMMEHAFDGKANRENSVWVGRAEQARKGHRQGKLRQSRRPCVLFCPSVAKELQAALDRLAGRPL